MHCFIYRNLNRKGHVYSFKALEGPYKGRVVAYAEAFTATDIEFRVSQAGWQRCIREQRRNVHAGIIGDVIEISGAATRLPHNIKVKPYVLSMAIGCDSITYNPYRTHGSFVACRDKVEVPVSTADKVLTFRNNILAFGAK